MSTEPDCWNELRFIPTGGISEIQETDTGESRSDTKLDRDTWLTQREIVLRSASRPAAVAATTVASVYKEEAERGEVFYRRGRGGTNLGRAVHSVLQSVDLATSENLEEISKAQAAAEGIAHRWQEVKGLAYKGLESPVVKRALASGKYYREVFVSLPIDEGYVEGFIDLLFEENGELVIVDYKTDVLDDDRVGVEKHDQYALQSGIYALAIGQVTRKPVHEVVLVFLHSGNEVVIQDIDAFQDKAKERARALLTGGSV